MTDVAIRLLSPEEFVETTASQYAFGTTPSRRNIDEARERIPFMEGSLLIGAFVDGNIQATCSFRTMTQNVRGRILPMTGIGGVASLPTGRRQGYVRRMIQFGFQQAHERGLPVSALYPFRESFYERHGFASCAAPRYASIQPEHVTALLRMNLSGEVHHTDIATGLDAWRAFLAGYQAGVHGFALTNEHSAEADRKANEDWLTTVTEEGTVTGAMLYRNTGYTGEMRISRWYTATANARYQLLGWIARHVDQLNVARVKLGPEEFPETWLADIQAKSSTEDAESWPAPMNRVLDIRAIDGIGCGDGQVTIGLVDSDCPWNNGTWTLTGESSGLRVTSSAATPDATLTIRGLSALVYNGSDPAMFRVRGWGDLDDHTASTLQAMFPPAHVVLNEEF